LPIIIVGSTPSAVPGLDPAGDQALAAVVAEFLQQPSVHIVASEADVAAELKLLGVAPSAQPATPGPVLSVHRQGANTDYYYLYNQTVVTPQGEPANLFDPNPGSPIDTTFTLEGHGQPYLLNTWTGQISPIATYANTANTVTVHVALPADGSEVVAVTSDAVPFSDPRLVGGCAGSRRHLGEKQLRMTTGASTGRMS